MKQALVGLAVLGIVASSAEGQTKPRWKLDFEHEKPIIYTYRNPLERLENFWYVIYTVTNNTDEVVPLTVDPMLYTETGKDLQHDQRKVDPSPTKETLDDARRYEALKFGRFHSNVIVPQEVEYKIIEYHAKIGNRSPGIVRESIEAFKKGFEEDPTAPDVRGKWRAGDRLYLNPREMRQQRHIKPGQRLHCIAIFRNVDSRARIIELHVSGLWDVVRVDGYETEDVKLHYENKVWKVSYSRPADEFEIEKDFLSKTRQEWVIKAIGPVASKETLGTLVDAMLARLKLEERWKSGDVGPEDAAKEQKLEQLTPHDIAIGARIIRLASGKDFGYDSEKLVVDNRAAIWRIHEWWVTNKTKLVFNEATGRFDQKDDKLPGAQD